MHQSVTTSILGGGGVFVPVQEQFAENTNKGWARETSLSPPVIHIDRSKTVVLMWSLLAVLVSEFRFVFVHYTFSSVWVAVWPPFGKYLPARLAICSHCILSICNIYFPFWFLGGGICLLVAPVPVCCFSVAVNKANTSDRGPLFGFSSVYF